MTELCSLALAMWAGILKSYCLEIHTIVNTQVSISLRALKLYWLQFDGLAAYLMFLCTAVFPLRRNSLSCLVKEAITWFIGRCHV